MEPGYRLSLRRHYSRLGFALLAYIAVTLAAQFGIQFAVIRWAPQLISRGWYLLALSFVPMYFIAFPIFLLILPKAPAPEQLPEKRKLPFRRLGQLLIMCFGILYPCNLLGAGVNAVISRLMRAPAENPLETLAMNSDLWVFGLTAVVLGPVMEELAFRKLLMDRMRTIDKPTAVFFSALTFALFHGNLSQFFYAFGVGVLFGIVYLRTGRIGYTIVLHILVNFFGSMVTTSMLQAIVPDDPMASILPAMVLGIYGLAVFAAAVAGIVLLVRERKALRLRDGQDVLTGASRFFVPYTNTGFLLYFFAALAVCVLGYL